MGNETPFEGGGFIVPVRCTPEQAAAARLTVCSIADRVAFGRVDAAEIVLQALGLIPYRPEVAA